MRRYRIAAAPSFDPVTVTGLGGVTLVKGDIITGEAAIRAIAIENGLARVTYELPIGGETGCHHLYIRHAGAWIACMDPHYGDWSGFVVPFPVGSCNRAVVLEATTDAVEISFEWTNYDLDTGYLGTPGLTERNHLAQVNYYQSSPTAHYITEIYLRKIVRLHRGLQGYFVTYHSIPDFTPPITAPGQTLNNDKDVTGERELGLGPGGAAAWASNGNRAYFPAWRSQRDWSAVLAAIPTFNNFIWWPGIDDPTYAPFNHPTVIAMQPPGYPAEQLTGPLWYVADIPPANYGGHPDVARVIAQKNPNEIGAWCYTGQGFGSIVNHLTNPYIEANGQRTRFTNFIAAVHHVSDPTAVAVAGYTGLVDYGNEPSTAVQTSIVALVQQAVDQWPT